MYECRRPSPNPRSPQPKRVWAIVQVTSYQAEQGVRDGRLVVLLNQFECQITPVNLVYASNRLLPVKLRAFIDFAVPKLEATFAFDRKIDRRRNGAQGGKIAGQTTRARRVDGYD